MSGIGKTRKIFLWLVLAMLALVISTRVASAHAYLVRSDPAPNSILATAPKQVTLWFDEAIDPNFSSIQVLDANQARVDVGNLAAAPNDPRQVHIAVKPLPEGTFNVVWKALSAADGHITRGVFAFSVGTLSSAPGSPGGSEQSGTVESDPLSVLARWVDLLSILTLAGALFFRDFVWTRSAGPDDSRTNAEWRQLFAAALLIALIAEILRLELQARLAAGAVTPDQIASLLFDTRIGTLWIVRWVALTVTGVLLLGIRTRVTALLAVGELGAIVILYSGILNNPGLIGQFGELWAALVKVGIGEHLVHIAPVFLFVLVVVARDKTARAFVTHSLMWGVLLTLALGSHSAGQSDLSLAVLADWLHLAAVSAWIGGLVAFVWIITPAWRAQPVESRRPWLASIVSRFSSMAIVSVLVIISTGIYNARVQVPGWNALFGTLYGRTLDAKLVLFALLLALGAVQLLWMRRHIAQAVTPERGAGTFDTFRRLIGTEVIVGAFVIGLAGLLTLIPPARSELPARPASSTPSTEPPSLQLLGHPAPDLNLWLVISPAPGESLSYDVLVTGEKKQPAPDILRVFIEFTLLDQDVGTTRVVLDPGTPGHYVVTGNYASLPGMWRMRVVVRRRGVEDVSTDFPYYVAGAKAANDPAALSLLQKSDAAMNQLKSMRSDQELNDGMHGEVTTRFEYAAPDGMHFEIVGQGESIAVGPTQYYFEQGVWQARPRVDPLVFPDFDNAAHASLVHPGRTESLNGESVQVVLATDNTSPDAHYAYWIGAGDFRVYQFAMVAPGHYMVQTYFDYNAPIQITAPPAK